jgi:hypothetical protein
MLTMQAMMQVTQKGSTDAFQQLVAHFGMTSKQQQQQLTSSIYYSNRNSYSGKLLIGCDHGQQIALNKDCFTVINGIIAQNSAEIVAGYAPIQMEPV